MLGSASIPFRAPLMSAMVPLVRGAPLPARVRGAVPRRVILRASEPAATAASTKAAERDPAALFRCTSSLRPRKGTRAVERSCRLLPVQEP